MIDSLIQWAIARILEIVTPGFYGSVTLKFENGRLVHLDHQQSEKPPARVS